MDRGLREEGAEVVEGEGREKGFWREEQVWIGGLREGLERWEEEELGGRGGGET